MIDITGVDLLKFVKEAYNLSSPQGMGFIHYQEGELSDADAQAIIDVENRNYAVTMDYVKGRSIKMHVRKEDGKLLINDDWYDHSDSQLAELLKRVGIKQEASAA